MESTFNWQPEQILLEKLLMLAHHRGQSPEAIVTEAITLYLEEQELAESSDLSSDSLVGLFAGSSDLASQSEDILQRDVTKKSGWTWKKPLL